MRDRQRYRPYRTPAGYEAFLQQFLNYIHTVLISPEDQVAQETYVEIEAHARRIARYLYWRRGVTEFCPGALSRRHWNTINYTLIGDYGFLVRRLYHDRGNANNNGGIYERVTDEDGDMPEEEDEVCAICSEYKATTKGYTECEHLFCLPCIRRMGLMIPEAGCPLCRRGNVVAMA